MSTTIRIYLLCYNRNDLLPRAIQSLIKQTYSNWICELHCDKPDNGYPAQLLAEINDSRINLVQHKVNLGLTEAFNVAFKEVEEKYISILEEDNWWEPNFLEVMLESMEHNPECEMAWANMRIWHSKDNKWIDSGHKIWELSNSHNRKFDFPHVQQIRSALHSQGSMLVRMHPYNPNLIIPKDLNSGALEAIRERAMSSPLLFVNQVLGNYAMLVESHRPKNSAIWSSIELCLISSFFNNVKVEKKQLERVLEKARSGKGKSIHNFVLAKVLNPKSSLKYSDFQVYDYFFFVGYYIKNISIFLSIMKSYGNLRDLRFWLNSQTKKSRLLYKDYETCQ